MSAVSRGFLTLPAPKVRSEHTKDQSGGASQSASVTKVNMIWIRNNSFIVYQVITGVKLAQHESQSSIGKIKLCGLTGLIGLTKIYLKTSYVDRCQDIQLKRLFN